MLSLVHLQHIDGSWPVCVLVEFECRQRTHACHNNKLHAEEDDQKLNLQCEHPFKNVQYLLDCYLLDRSTIPVLHIGRYIGII